MGKFKEITGELIEAVDTEKFDIIGHGCDCQKTMNGGVYTKIVERYPQVRIVNSNYYRPQLGEYSKCDDYKSPIILNCYTQVYSESPNDSNDTSNMRYDAMFNMMTKINKEYKGKHIGLTSIGNGLSWERVKEIIKKTLIDMDVTIVK